RTVTLPRLRPTHVAALLGVALVGVIALALALARGNNPYYVGADVYHWYVEGVLVALVTVAALGRGSARDAARGVAVVGVLIGVVCVATFVLGTLRMIDGG